MQFLDDGGAALGRKRIARHERARVLARRVLAHLGEKRLEVLGRRRQQLVVRRNGGVRGQDERIRTVVARIVEERREIHGDRHQDHAVERHALALQPVHDAAGARRAVALAEQVLGRVPAAVVADVLADEARDRLDVRVRAPEVLVLGVADGLGEARADRIDHDEVGLVEDAVGVVHDLVGRRRRGPGVGRDDAAGPERPHVQPDRGGARPAVERERDRPAAAGRVLLDVGDVAMLAHGSSLSLRTMSVPAVAV